MTENNFPVEKYRFRFTSEYIVNAAPIVESFPAPRRAGDPPLTVIGDEKHFLVTASALRGMTRRRVFKNIVNKLRRVNPNIKFNSADVRLMLIGGVKSSGRSEHLNPQKTARVRQMRPDLEIYGMNDPTFLGGCFECGMIVSILPMRTDRLDPDATIPIIRRTLLNDRILDDVELSDSGAMDELSQLNHVRSKVENALKKLARIERKERSAKDQREYEQALAAINEFTETPVANAEEATIFLNAMKEKMKQEGFSDVSEANLQLAATIPAGTQMRHLFHLNQISLRGAGLFLSGWHDAWCFDPAIGGMAARGAGGYITFVYTVERQEGYDWVPDCTVRIEPDVGVTFSNDRHSVLRLAFEEWAKVDITQYDFTFAALKAFVAGEK